MERRDFLGKMGCSAAGLMAAQIAFASETSEAQGKKQGKMRGDVGSKATYRYFSKSCNSSEVAKRFTADVVIPRKRAISAPE